MNRVTSPATTLVASCGFGFDGVSASTGSEESAVAAEGSREGVPALASGACRPPPMAVAGAECSASADPLAWVRDRLEAWGILVGGADSSSATSTGWTATSD
jgi:hypothetical protein